jgi:hypothetical protein
MNTELEAPPETTVSETPDEKPNTESDSTARTDLRTNLISVKLNDTELDLLDKLARKHFIGKSTVLRMLLANQIQI